ncbi:PREDICTED: mucin-5AC isoform X2 [Drosophila arizonae]|uniref:Mucin-5AC isoform X2 n=1 Tax=Drosophila arizonae TaxID=7263 RepID=A0ABM1NN82_DROAR|nr:PREDICTED: mucin-5AC isoform X2 [Drosophila arizonae]
MRSQHPTPILASLSLCLVLAVSLQPQLLHCATAGGLKAAILRSDRINDGTLHRSQSKRAATLAKSLPFITAPTRIVKANDGETVSPTAAAAAAAEAAAEAAAAAMQTNAEPSVAVAVAVTTAIVETALSSRSSINNISNNDDRQRLPGQGQGQVLGQGQRQEAAAAVLQANLIMSNRSVEQQDPYVHKYRITQNNALFSHSNGSTATAINGAAMAKATMEQSTASTTTTAATPTTTTAAATTTTTTRRPAPRTTLKPPPTIDDYQTIISQAGTHAYLPCNVKQLVKKPISWLRMRDGHILTVDQTTFIADQRFQSVFSPNPERWSLQIKYVQLKDEGTYECQVSTEPKASAIVHLRIVEPKTELIGESTRHVKAGSQVKLRCIISQALEPPLFINWFYNQKQIYLHNRRGWRTEIERIDLPTEVPTTPTAATSTAAADSLNDITAITRSYILDAITVSDEEASAGYGYVLPATATPTAATMSTTAATAAVALAAAATAAAAAGVASGQGVAANDMLTTAAAAGDKQSTMTTAAAAVAAGDATTTIPTTTTTTEPITTPATTTTMLPSSSFIKQITAASLIIPAVVKLDSGNYTCSPSNSAPRTIVLHVLNGEYSASAIKSGSVSWNALIGCPGYSPWRNISTILTLLWIIKFVSTSHRGRNKVNRRTAAAALQEPASTKNRTTSGASVSRRLCSQMQTTTRRQGFDDGACGGSCGHVSSSISGTKVAEDKT